VLQPARTAAAVAAAATTMVLRRAFMGDPSFGR
jgi:hypothetical protein